MRLIIIRNENNSHSQINKGKEKDIMKKIAILGIILTFFTNLCFAAEVNVFSARHYDSDIQLYKKFTEKTGIKVNVVSGKDKACLLYTSPSPRDRSLSRMPSSA